ncbi:hypothetical protein [uncultured Aquimarina sp.]|uniref:hypothetical protein n=1 Tax=uncultured Aquimarina sp. TaxID=575652 RepID=UPI00263069B5|nr:hypothetical protein [uncultured Aquimarina sp.]
MSVSKTIPFFVILLFTFTQCKKKDSSIDPLLAPDNWRKETIVFPLSFAPSLNYKGTEYVRFAPGWGKQGSEEYFTYSFLWYLDEDPKLSSSSLESEMEAYFDGLTDVVSKPESGNLKNISRTKAFFEKVDNQSFAGKIITYDAFTANKEVNLNLVATYSFCENLEKHLVLFRISPKPINHPVWDKLNEVQIDLNCR